MKYLQVIRTRFPRYIRDQLQMIGRKIKNEEQKRREEKKIERHLKWATFPYHKTLEQFDIHEQDSLSQKQFNKLKELIWIEQIYNLILLGPPGYRLRD